MGQVTAGIRELKAHLSTYIRQVKAGEVVIITERGKQIARIVPTEPSTQARLKELEHAGLIAWSGRRLGPTEPVAHTRGLKAVAEILLEDRE
jgi:prevent-host-death family protein